MAGEPILVTGAAGFIGFCLARRLLENGRSVVGVDNVNSYYDPAEARLAVHDIVYQVHSNSRDRLWPSSSCGIWKRT